MKAKENKSPDLEALLRRIQELESAAQTNVELERARLRKELHDGLSQHLGGLVLLAKSLTNSLQSAQRPEAEPARELTQLLYTAVTQTRDLINHLARPK